MLGRRFHVGFENQAENLRVKTAQETLLCFLEHTPSSDAAAAVAAIRPDDEAESQSC